MKKRNNDESYMDITDIIGSDYTPQNKLPRKIGSEIMEKLLIYDETDTIITGSLKEWEELVCFLFDKFKEYEDELNTKEIEFDIRHLKPNKFQQNIMSDFFKQNIILYTDKIPDVIKLKGTFENYDRFYQLMKRIERDIDNSE